MRKIDLVIRLLVLKDCITEGTSLFQFFMMYYLYCTYILNGTSLLLINSYILLPIGLYILAPPIGLITFGLINMIWLLPRKQAYYMAKNVEWKQFREEIKK